MPAIFAIGIISGLFTAWVERRFVGAMGSEFSFTVIDRCLIAGRAFWFYLYNSATSLWGRAALDTSNWS